MRRYRNYGLSRVQEIGGVQFQVVVQGPGTVRIDNLSAMTAWPRVVEVPANPVAPLYFMVLMHSETPQAYIRSRDYFTADATKFERMAQMPDEALLQALRDDETYRLAMSTGELLRDQPGGYQYVAQTFGRKPVALGVPARGPRLKATARRVYREFGAKVIVEHHESGTQMDVPFEYLGRLLLRPSDFSVTRWALPGGPKGRKGRGQFWWNMVNTPLAEAYNPTGFLKKRLAEWNGTRPPLITCIIHENNFFRQRMTPFTYIYWSDSRKNQALKPPYDLNARDGSEPRSAQNIKQIWDAYEAVVAFSAANLRVVTSEDIASMAASTNPTPGLID